MMMRRGVLLLAGAALLLAAFAGIVGSAPPRFTSFAAAIGHVLDGRGIAHRTIFLEQRWPDSVNDQRYGAHLLVVLDDGRRVAGRLKCRTGQQDCQISLMALAIEREPIPGLSTASPTPWQRVLARVRHALSRWWPA
jgi:hypothetical protein